MICFVNKVQNLHKVLILNSRYFGRGKEILESSIKRNTAMAKVNELIQRLDHLQTTNYADPASARAHNYDADEALKIIFDIGREKISFTEEEKQAIANKLATALRPIQVNVQNHAFEFNPKIHTVLEKRSALQFLLDDYGNLSSNDGKLSNVFDKLVLKETIHILDDIIEKNRSESSSDKELIKRYKDEYGSDSESESESDYQGVPSSHSWWAL